MKSRKVQIGQNLMNFDLAHLHVPDVGNERVELHPGVDLGLGV
jgi:hypothetical protein